MKIITVARLGSPSVNKRGYFVMDASSFGCLVNANGNALGSIQRHYPIFDPIYGVSVVGPGIEQVLTDKGSGSCEGW